MENLYDKKILVVGAARNCARKISKEIERIETALSPFKEVRYFVVESDSDDGTPEKLEAMRQANPRFDYSSLGTLREQFPRRTERIAHCRNHYLDALDNSRQYDDVDYVVVTDLDGTNTHLTETNFLSNWDSTEWDVVTANQKGIYYDIWALRHPILSPNDCLSYYNFLVEELGIKKFAARKIAIHSRMITIPKSDKLIEVDSAFGGMAIYKREVLMEARYVGLQDGREICEHVPLHEQIRHKGYRICINPNFINCAPPLEHVKLVSLGNLLKWLLHLPFNGEYKKLYAHAVTLLQAKQGKGMVQPISTEHRTER